jgi:hypothetical protein
MFFPSLLYKSQETVMHWDVSFPFPSSNNPKKIGVFDPTYKQTNKQPDSRHYSRDSREMVFMKEAGGRSGEQQKRDFKC